MSTRYVTTAMNEPQVSYPELVTYLHSPKAPVGASAGQVRAVAGLFLAGDGGTHPAMRALAEGSPEVDAEALLKEATEELEWAEPATIASKALQSLINWLLVGSGRVQEIRTI